MSISGTIKSIQDTMREDVGVDGDVQRLGQLVWMLFLKVIDDRENELATLALLEGQTFKSPIPEKFRWRNWAANDEGMTGDELKDFIDNELFPALQNLAVENDDPRARVVQNVFSDAYNYMKSGGLIRKIINQIQKGFDFNKSKERHAFGDIYEQLLRDLQAAKNSGEFYTPRAVTTFMAQIVDPQVSQCLTLRVVQVDSLPLQLNINVKTMFKLPKMKRYYRIVFMGLKKNLYPICYVLPI